MDKQLIKKVEQSWDELFTLLCGREGDDWTELKITVKLNNGETYVKSWQACQRRRSEKIGL